MVKALGRRGARLDRPPPPRAPRRHRLSRPARRRADPDRRQDHLRRRHLRRDHLGASVPPGPGPQEGARHPQVRGRHAARPSRRESVLRDLLRAPPAGAVGVVHQPALTGLLMARRRRGHRGLRRPGGGGGCGGRSRGDCGVQPTRRADQTRAPRRARDRGRLLLARPATNTYAYAASTQAAVHHGSTHKRVSSERLPTSGRLGSQGGFDGKHDQHHPTDRHAGRLQRAARAPAPLQPPPTTTPRRRTKQRKRRATRPAAQPTRPPANGETTTTGTPAPPKEGVNSKEIKKAKEEEAKKVKEEERKAREEAKRLKEAEAKKAKEEELRVEEDRKS